MKPRTLTHTLVMVLLAAGYCAHAAVADDEPLPMRTEQPIVYATPIKNTVILEFKLYDNKTWCWLYIEKEVWDEVRQKGGLLPAGADRGQLQCERR